MALLGLAGLRSTCTEGITSGIEHTISITSLTVKMADERPQYIENKLTPLPVNAATLSESLQELRAAVRKGAELIHANDPLPEKWVVGGMFKHFPGMQHLSVIYTFLHLPLEDRKQSMRGASLTDSCRGCPCFPPPRFSVPSTV